MQPRALMKRIRLFLFGTALRILIFCLCILGCGLVIFLSWLSDNVYTLTGGIKGHPEYCDHFFTPDTGIRLAITPYAFPERNGGHKLDPNNWQKEQLAYDFLSFQVIVVPFVDYEITHDGGTTWNHFWRYYNHINEYPWCSAFDSLDEANFWMWSRTEIAITHDAGASWILGDDYKRWAKNPNPYIDYIKFDTPDSGQLVFLNGANKTDPTLLTQDGGKTWYIDPSWNQ